MCGASIVVIHEVMSPQSKMAEKSEEKRVGCSFFLKRKNRYCKMIPGKGKKYCGEHLYLADENQV